MKKKILKKDIINYLSLFFDIEKKYLNKYLKTFSYKKDILKIKLLFPKNIKTEIWIIDNNKKMYLKNTRKELIIINIKRTNDEILKLKRKNNISYYTLDIVKAKTIIPTNQKEKNLKELAYIHLKLNLNNNKKHDIIRKRRTL